MRQTGGILKDIFAGIDDACADKRGGESADRDEGRIIGQPPIVDFCSACRPDNPCLRKGRAYLVYQGSDI